MNHQKNSILIPSFLTKKYFETQNKRGRKRRRKKARNRKETHQILSLGTNDRNNKT